ncbi:alpha/beta fold hydrolase [Dyella choica]|uniref:Alpha/beta hydrolase n=1 Tax=Dyella choica TaxID=1927959 RepID=A0A3S0RJA6_9GAMM|nr:alpha/beta hydrolase [Dyella choica]RUL73127.1 alpha/beta hydrolase [Dyella choica]
MESIQTHPSAFLAADGLTLAVDVRNPSGKPTLLFAHGFGQTRGAWNAAATTMAARGCRCVSFDSRGHGESTRASGGDYHMQQFVDDLRALAHAQPEPAILVGASMGGLLGLVVAGELRPSPFRALVLVDITPRWETAGVERILAFMQAHPDGFASYAEAADQIAAYLPQRRERKSEQQLRPLLREGADGRLRWHWDPALLAGDLISECERYQPRLLEAAAKVEVPVLLLSGERSDVVSQHTVEEFLALVPHAQHAQVPGATHMLAGDANDAFTAAIAGFIGSLEPAFRPRDEAKQPA